MLSFNSIQFNTGNLYAPTYKLSRLRALRTKINMINVTQEGTSGKKVSLQFNSETVKRKFSVGQMHWESIPDSRR